jgi:hypothetical protein
MHDLLPYAEVTLDDRIVGHDSEIHRQIDVSARWSDGPDTYLLIVQAKDWKKPADVTIVDAFRGAIADVRANAGVLICSGGFSKSAITYAKRVGIRLYDLHDAGSVNWSHELTIPFLWTDYTPQIDLGVIARLEAGDTITDRPKYGPFTLSPDGGVKVLTVMDTFVRNWNSGNLPRTLDAIHGVHSTEPLDLTLLVTDENGEPAWRPAANLDITYSVRRQAWLGQYRPTECRGLIDFLDGRAFIPTFIDLRDLPTRDNSWIPVDDPDGIVPTIRGAILTSENHEILVQGQKFSDYNARYLGR